MNNQAKVKEKIYKSLKFISKLSRLTRNIPPANPGFQAFSRPK